MNFRLGEFFINVFYYNILLWMLFQSSAKIFFLFFLPSYFLFTIFLRLLYTSYEYSPTIKYIAYFVLVCFPLVGIAVGLLRDEEMAMIGVLFYYFIASGVALLLWRLRLEKQHFWNKSTFQAFYYASWGTLWSVFFLIYFILKELEELFAIKILAFLGDGISLIFLLLAVFSISFHSLGSFNGVVALMQARKKKQPLLLNSLGLFLHLPFIMMFSTAIFLILNF